MAWSYYRTLTITSNSALLPSTQTNFPVLVKISDATLKTAANGGHVQNTVTAASGPAVTMPADLIFTSDLAGSTKIPWEVESYDGTNGILWAWVQIASCALSTVFYVFYGDVSVVAAQNTGSFTPANVWDANYKLVYHLNGGTLLATDSTSNANNGTITAATATTGQVNGAGSFDGSTTWIKSASNALNPSTTDFTASLWANATDLLSAFCMLSQLDGVGTGRSWLSTNVTTGVITCTIAGSATAFTGALAAGVASHLTLTKTGTTVRLYLNGVIDPTTKTATVESATGVTELGATKVNGAVFKGVLDELRISSTLRTANWITAEYSSQNAPTTFVTVGGELTPSTGALVGGGLLMMGIGI